jgi:cellobiose epimerase
MHAFTIFDLAGLRRAGVWLVFFLGIGSALAGTLQEHAREFREQVAEKFMPYWHDTAQDTVHGGYVLADHVSGPRTAKEKQLVTQSRMIWGFSHAHLKGFSTSERNYLKAATQGYEFLLRHFLDRENGGYFWKTDLEGNPTNSRKIVYGQAFVMYAFVEYHRASGDREALRHALDLYQALQKHSRDPQHGGWIEHFTADWKPILKPEPGAEVEVPGYKSANTHLHLMEALTELYQTTENRAVGKSLQESLRLNATWFYPKDAGKSAYHRQLDWRPVTDPKSAGLSYGHNVEFAWLMIRAEQVLGRRPSWDHFDAHLQHALKYGYDHQRGGLYNTGVGDAPAQNTDKIWWVQTEMMAALTDGVRFRKKPEYAEALEKLIHFLLAHQIDPKDGIWIESVAEDGAVKSGAKAHNWKANYHDLRALIKFVETFAQNTPSAPRRR